MKPSWKWGNENNCDLYMDDSVKNPVHKHSDGTWWFYDETWCHEFGPFTEEMACKESCKEYGGSL